MNRLFLLVSCFFLTFGLFSSAFASESVDFKKKLDSKLNEISYYNKGSVLILSESDIEMTFESEKRKVKAFFVGYETKRDHIFIETHKDFFYYDIKNDNFIDDTLVPNERKNFEDVFKDEMNTSNNYYWATIFIFAMLAVCYYIIYVHNQNKYSYEAMNFTNTPVKKPFKKKKRKKR